MNTNGDKRLVEAIERIGKILASLYAFQMGDVDQGEKAKHLSRCGFSNVEIAELLGTTPNTVNVALHKTRKGKKKGKRTK